MNPVFSSIVDESPATGTSGALTDPNEHGFYHSGVQVQKVVACWVGSQLVKLT